MRWVHFAFAVGLLAGCQPSTGVASAVDDYRQAIETKDAAQLHRMLTQADQVRMAKEDIGEKLHDQSKEMAGLARALRTPVAVEVHAHLTYVNGAVSEMVWEDGRFRLMSLGGLPAGATTPEDALADLRGVLLARSYPALLRALTAESRRSIDSDLAALAKGLESPSAVNVQRMGDRAVATTPSGHTIRLRKELEGWKIEDFE